MSDAWASSRLPIYRHPLGRFAAEWLAETAREYGGSCALFQDALERAQLAEGEYAVYLTVDTLPALPESASGHYTWAQAVQRVLEHVDAVQPILTVDSDQLYVRIIRAHLRAQPLNLAMTSDYGNPGGPMRDAADASAGFVAPNVWGDHPYWIYRTSWYALAHAGRTDEQVLHFVESLHWPLGIFWVARKPPTAALPEARNVVELTDSEAAQLTDSVVALCTDCCDGVALLEWLAPGVAPPIKDGEVLA